jgi:alpha-D-xyloside xylohydrolase
LSIATKISRRALAKRLAVTGIAARSLRLLGAETSGPARAAETGEWTKVYPGVWRATLGMPERFTPVSSRMMAPNEPAFEKLPRVEAAPLPEISGQRIERGYVVHLPLHAGEQIYGFGLQFLSFAQRGKKKVVRVNADPKVDTGDSNAPVPFYVTTEGIGVLVDTARYANFYLGDAHPKATNPASLAAQADAPNDTHTVKGVEAGLITVEVPHAGGADVYLFAGPTMLDAVKRYNVFSGGGVTPPDWGLGLWYRLDAQASDQEALDLARELRASGIPCDVIGLEPGWQSHAYSCTFVWDKDRFPDPEAFLRSTGEMHYKVNLWEHAFTNPASPLFPVLEPHSGNYGVWGGLVPDFAGAPAREAFGAYHGSEFVDKGVSGFKLDECDNSDYTGGWSFPECSSFPSGVDGEQMHSVFGLLYQKTLWDEYRQRRQPTYCLVRSSGALAAPYPFVLYSDLYDHRQYIRALVNSGFSGLLWCPEVRQAASEEDLIRRLQSVVFSPLAQVDCWYIKNPPWKQFDRQKNNAGQLLPDWQRLQARCREIIGWRMQLIPYLQAAFALYAQDGTPPFRALALDAPQAQRLLDVDDQYMVGDRMMVAPLFAGESGRNVVLPQGDWHDFWTGEPVQSDTEIFVPATTERIPAYVKSGSVFPWADVGLFAGAPETRRITVRVYGDGSLPFTLGSAKDALRLSWRDGAGSFTGVQSGYEIYAWKHLG